MSKDQKDEKEEKEESKSEPEKAEYVPRLLGFVNSFATNLSICIIR